MSVGIEWLDASQLIVAYLPAAVRLNEIGKPVGSADADPRYRQYNELAVFQDVEAIFNREAGADLAKDMSATQGPDAHYRSAYVVQKAVDVGLLRLFNNYRERDEDAAQVFLEIEPALEFLGVSDPEVCKDVISRLRAHAASNGEEVWF